MYILYCYIYNIYKVIRLQYRRNTLPKNPLQLRTILLSKSRSTDRRKKKIKNTYTNFTLSTIYSLKFNIIFCVYILIVYFIFY